MMKSIYALCASLMAISAYAGDLPDPSLTPGAINPDLTAEKLCAKGFTTKDYRATSEATKRAVCIAYGLEPHCYGIDKAEIDHLISLELGGQDVAEDLWPQSYISQPWNAHLKDKLENTLHRLVCAKTITLEEAQTAIRTNWIDAYHRYVSPTP